MTKLPDSFVLTKARFAISRRIAYQSLSVHLVSQRCDSLHLSQKILPRTLYEGSQYPRNKAGGLSCWYLGGTAGEGRSASS